MIAIGRERPVTVRLDAMRHLCAVLARLVGVCGMAATLTVCGGTTEPNVCDIEHQQQVQITVTVGPPTVISWTPECPAGALQIEINQGGLGDLVWAVTSYSTQDGTENLLTPPIEYGILPSTADTTWQFGGPGAWHAQPLVPGTIYAVTLYRYACCGYGIPYANMFMGSVNFVR